MCIDCQPSDVLKVMSIHVAARQVKESATTVRTLVSVTFVSVTGRDACMRAKSCGLFETSCFAPLRSILACVFALLLVQC